MTAQTTRAYVLANVKEFMEETGTSPCQLGIQAVGSNKFWRQLQAGSATLKTIEKVEAFIATYRANRDPRECPFTKSEIEDIIATKEHARLAGRLAAFESHVLEYKVKCPHEDDGDFRAIAWQQGYVEGNSRVRETIMIDPDYAECY